MIYQSSIMLMFIMGIHFRCLVLHLLFKHCTSWAMLIIVVMRAFFSLDKASCNVAYYNGNLNTVDCKHIKIVQCMNYTLLWVVIISRSQRELLR